MLSSPSKTTNIFSNSLGELEKGDFKFSKIAQISYQKLIMNYSFQSYLF